MPGLHPPSPRFLVALTLAVSCAALYGLAVEREPPNGDEPGWMQQGANSWRLLREARFDDPYWSRADATWGYASPTFSKYLIGLGMSFQGWGPDSVVSNKTAGNTKIFAPSPDGFRAGRLSSVVIGAAGVVTLFLVLSRTQPLTTAALAAVLLATHPLWFRASRRAMPDIHAATMTLFALWAFATARARTRAGASGFTVIAWWIFVGALLGASVCCKFTAVGAALGLVALLVVEGLWSARREGVGPIARGLLAPVVCGVAAAVTFLATYPYLWPAPVRRLRNIAAVWDQVYASRVTQQFSGFETAFRPGTATFRALSDVLILPGGAASWLLLLPLAIAPWLRMARPRPDFARALTWLLAVPALLGGAFLAAGAQTLSQSWIAWAGFVGATTCALAVPGTRAGLRENVVLVAWLLGAATSVLPATYIAWPRYYLPLIPGIAVLAAFGFVALWRSVREAGGLVSSLLLAVAVAAGVASLLACWPSTGGANFRRVAGADVGDASKWLQRVAAASLAVALVTAVARAWRTGLAAAPHDGTRAGPR